MFIPRESNVDIDQPEDWHAAEILHKVIEEKAMKKSEGDTLVGDSAPGPEWMNSTFVNVALPWFLTGISMTLLAGVVLKDKRKL